MRKGILILGIVLIVGLILASLQFLGVVNLLGIVGYETVYKANYGHICCEEGAYEPKYIRHIDDAPLYKCNAYTDECRIIVHPAQDLGFFGKSVLYQICDLNGNSCTTLNKISFMGYSKTTDQRNFVISYGRSIKFSQAAFPNANDWKDIQYDADYRKFYIQGVENGKVFVAKSCILNSALKQRVLAGGLNELSKIGSNRCQNYITDYVLVDTRTYSYNFQEVLCQARDIYEIDKITLLDGSTRKIQGERIKGVECCPHEANCDEDTFEFKEDVIKECTYTYECPNGGLPVTITGTSYITYDCISYKCVQSDSVTVECTNNAICVDKLGKPNAVCKNFKCVEDDSWIGHCGDGECESVLGETPTSCPDDCAGNGEDGFQWNNLYWLPIILAVGLSALMGWKDRERTGKYNAGTFIIWGILGAIIGLVAMWVIQNWIWITLIALFGSGLSLALILIIGGVPLLIVILGMMRKK